MGKIGAWEWIVILGILLLLFGAAKLPAIGRGLGEGIRNFRNSFREGSDAAGKEDGKTDQKPR
ncbi:MAG TPA: twin-arginine translocase TatA/TatE family subunit [Candidatus Polarisedimenticolia bacterium]|nr:twin-arginine translocase TatA/TatE family subunit [Candidatus Polarisedimenticolia bacterium]